MFYTSSDSIPTTCYGSNFVLASTTDSHSHTTTHIHNWGLTHLWSLFHLSLYLWKTNILHEPIRGSWDILNFTLTGATAWPLVQHRRHSFSPCVVIFHSQPPRSGHLKPGWSGHFVCWACVSSPASRAEGPATSWNICRLIASKNNEPETAVMCWILTPAAQRRKVAAHR